MTTKSGQKGNSMDWEQVGLTALSFGVFFALLAIAVFVYKFGY